MVPKSKMKSSNDKVRMIIKGLSVSLITTAAAVMVFAKVVSAAIVSEGNMIYCAVVSLIIAATSGIVTTNSEDALVVPSAICLSYVLILLSITALFFGGRYHSAGPVLIAVIGGTVLGILLKKGRIATRKPRRTKIPRR